MLTSIGSIGERIMSPLGGAKPVFSVDIVVAA